jgi:putative spermidine/putrescine transport system ATP-binding protein
VDAPVPDGPATLAIRPEALSLRSAEPGQARVHRVTDYGSHGMVDLDLADGFRLKAMVPDPDHFRPGQGVDLAPSRVTLYRDDRRVWRS